MDDVTSRPPRLVVGISRSRASWWALAWATGEARKRGARLLLAHVYRPPLFPSMDPDPRYSGLRYSGLRDNPGADRAAAGNRLIWAAIGEAVGHMPRDIIFDEAIVPGRPAAELARLTRGGDVLVLGARHRGWLRRHAPGSVARACTRRADCLVMIVPEPSPSEIAAALPTDVRSHWRRWPPHRDARMTP